MPSYSRKLSPAPQPQVASVPAPIGGLNARDSLADMEPTDALILDNMFPTPSSVDVRNGYENWTTGLPNWVESLMPYSSAVGSSDKLFGASGTAIYNVTASGAVGAAVVTGQTNARWQSINFATAGANYLYCVNGADDPELYNGTAWQAINSGSSPVFISGVTTANLIHINAFKSRIFLTEKNTMKVWYLPVGQVGGAATSIDFGSLCTLGGYLMGMCTWSVADAQGLQEYAVFITSEGEVLVYGGYDPSSSSTWQLVAHFRIGRPIGRRFFEKVGSDLVLVTADGAVTLSKSLLTDRSQLKIALTDKITKLINSDVQAYSTHFGWQPVLYPLGNKLIVNVPQTENSRQFQYVMNTINGSWCSFGKYNSPWNASCFAEFNNELYFGGNTITAKCDIGNTDNNGSIYTSAKSAFNYFGQRGQQKYFTMARPIFTTNGTIQAAIDLNMDFSDLQPTSTPALSSFEGALWDVAMWDVALWAADLVVDTDWQTLGGIGFCAAMRMQLQTQGVMASWIGTDFVYQSGGVL